MKTLVIFDKDWADEFDVKAFAIYDQDIEGAKSDLIENRIGKETWFGTNEGWEEGEITMNDFEFKEITDEEAEVITRLIGRGFGTCSF